MSDARVGGVFGLGVGGVDPVACRGAAGSLDAAYECRHGRLPHDATPACGCWVENAPRSARARPRPPGGWTEAAVLGALGRVSHELGRWPARADLRSEVRPWVPSQATVYRVCGGWPQEPARERRAA